MQSDDAFTVVLMHSPAVGGLASHLAEIHILRGGMGLQTATFPQDPNNRQFCLFVRLARIRSNDEVKAMMAPPETVEEAVERLTKKARSTSSVF